MRSTTTATDSPTTTPTPAGSPTVWRRATASRSTRTRSRPTSSSSTSATRRRSAPRARPQQPGRGRSAPPTPMIRTEDGAFREASWEEALALIAEKLPPLLEAHGRDACAVYLGNPSAHSLAASLYGRPLLKAIGTKNVYSASTVDQYPKQ